MTADEAFSASLAGGLIAAPGSQIVIAEWIDPGGGEPPQYIAPLHVHHMDDEPGTSSTAPSSCGRATATSTCRLAAG